MWKLSLEDYIHEASGREVGGDMKGIWKIMEDQAK